MINKHKNSNQELSERQKLYYEEILPKLSQEVVKLNLGMRANTCLVSAEIFTKKQLEYAIMHNEEIPMLGKELREEIMWKLGI